MEIIINNNKTIKLNELIKHTLNTDSLATMFEFILDNNKNAVNEIDDCKMRCTRIEDEQKKTEEILFKLNTQEKKLNDIQTTLYSYNSRFIDLDTKIYEISNKVETIEDLGKKLEENLKKFYLLEENFSLVNKLTEENIKNIEKTSESVNLLKELISIEKNKDEEFKDNFSKDLQMLIERSTIYEDNIKKIEKKTIQHGEYFLDIFEKLNPKDNEENLSQKLLNNLIFDENENILDKNKMNKNFKSLSNFSDNFNINNDSKHENKLFNESIKDKLNNNIDVNDISDHDNLINSKEDNSISKKNSINLDIRSPLKKISESGKNKELAILKSNFEMSLSLMKNQFKQLDKDLNSKINELKAIVNNQENYLNNRILTSDNNDNNSVFQMPIIIKNEIDTDHKENKKNLIDNLQKFNDNTLNIKLLEIEDRIQDLENNNKVKFRYQNISTNMNSKNYNTVNRNTSVNINKSEDFNNHSNIFDDGSSANGSNINNQNQSEINNEENSNCDNTNKNLVKGILESTAGKNLITSKIKEEFLKLKISNEYNSSILSDISKHNDDINKIYESILIIRKTLAEKENDKQSNPIIDNMVRIEENLNQHILSTEKKLNGLDKVNKKIKEFIDESHKGLIELKFDDTGNSLKDFFKTILFNLRQNVEKADKNNIRLDNLSVELLSKLKKDLQIDSQKLFEEFKEELKNRLIIIDDQIKAKVDIYNFDDFGKQLDKKIGDEFSKKIDRIDLKRNNTLITKKIEHLQEKISKTLIDALTDIQLEEAPLIVKTSLRGNKCGSCNQVLVKEKIDETNNVLFSSPRTDSRSKILMPLSPIQPEKISFLKNIQEASNIGSYSKLLSNFDEENLNEFTLDLRDKPNNYNNLINLPDVINKRSINLNSAQLKKHFRNKSTIITSSKLIKNNFTTNTNNLNNISVNPVVNDNKFYNDNLKSFLDNEIETNSNLLGDRLIKAVDKFHGQCGK